jgi:hypothetical protein
MITASERPKSRVSSQPLRLLATSLLLVASSCSIPTDAPSHTSIADARSVRADGSKSWLPVGTVVPVGVPVSSPPEPYDPSRHTLLIDSTSPFINLARAPGFENFPKRGMAGKSHDAPPPGNGDRGFWLVQASRAWYGMSSMYDLNLSLGLPSPWGGHDVYVYAPTTQAPGGACIEVVQVYRRLNGGATTGKYYGLWDWCIESRFVILEAQITSWTNRYVRTYQGKPMYAVSIATPNTGSTYGQCWYATIYDYLLGGWVQKLQRCGAPLHSFGATGWTMWESWYLTNGACPTLPSIRALDISLYDPQTSNPVPFSDWPSDYSALGPYGVCWPSGPYSFESPIAGLGANSWRGNTPYP